MVIYCILTGLLVYYIALWLWYRYTDSRTSPGRTDDAPLPRNGVSGYTLIGESRYKGGLIGTAQDKSGQRRTNRDTSRKRLKMILFLRRRLTDSRKKTFRKQQPKRKKRPVTRMTNPTTRTRK